MSIAAPFAYFGGKSRLASQIVDLLPAHDHYVEPFAGSLAVLLAKPRSKMETVNDRDGHLMTFWRVLRDQPEELARLMALTPHSRAEYVAAADLDSDLTDIERARRVWVLLAQGRAGTLRNTGWRYYANPAGSSIGMPGYLAGYVSRVCPAAERLAGVSLEARTALEVIEKYGAHPRALIYADPPYVGSTRSANYRYEMTSDGEHAELAAALVDCKAAVVLSGYHSPLYEDLYDGWHRAELKAWTGNGIRNGATKTDGDRTEVLWSNRPFPLEDLPLFEVTA